MLTALTSAATPKTSPTGCRRTLARMRGCPRQASDARSTCVGRKWRHSRCRSHLVHMVRAGTRHTGLRGVSAAGGEVAATGRRRVRSPVRQTRARRLRTTPVARPANGCCYALKPWARRNPQPSRISSRFRDWSCRGIIELKCLMNRPGRGPAWRNGT